MKRTSWGLVVVDLPKFSLWDSTNGNGKTNGQTSIDLTNNKDLKEESYFIGIVGTGDNKEKLLCYHTKGGSYIVVSRNYTADKLFESIIDINLKAIDIIPDNYNSDKTAPNIDNILDSSNETGGGHNE